MLSVLLLLCMHSLVAIDATAFAQEDPPKKSRRAVPSDSVKSARTKVNTPAQRAPTRERARTDAQRWKPTDRKTDTNIVQPPPIFTPFPLRTPPAGVVYDTGVWKPARGTDDRFTKLLTERNLTPEEAVEELLTLLEKHPEFRRTILREIFAGEGMKTVKPLEIEEYLRLAMKAMRFKSSYEYELAKRGGGGYTGPYDPIYGFDRDKTLGFQVNVFELLKFLKGLIGE
ncbi:MAG: hypothetical protein IPP94_17135 [Ignavibacteria bacterium]|nr:hypothetical protein [Ignavibacteria bacterium]